MLDREVDDRAADLHSFVIPGQERGSLLDEDKGSKFALVIFQKELAPLKFDFRVAAANRDVIDAQVAFMATAQLEHCLVS